jgi:hypothetical protein
MTEFYGKDLNFQWVGTAGTLDMSEYQRGASFSPSGKIDVNTTGAAGYETRQVGVKDFTASYRGLWQAGTAGTATTTMENTLRFGESGTVLLSPEGTAAGTRKYTLPVISQGPQVNLAYDGLTEINISFVGNGTVTYGAN